MDLDALYHISPIIEALHVNAFSLEKNTLRTASKLSEMAAGQAPRVSAHR